jgi:hypothetical protein
MPERLVIRGEEFLVNYQQIVGISWLRELWLWALWNSEVEDFAQRPWNPNWVVLELQEDSGDDYDYANDSTRSLIAMANCPQVRQLRKLEFSLFSFTPAGIGALAGSPYLDQLQSLTLDESWTLDSKLDAPKFQSLRERFGSRLRRRHDGTSPCPS